MDAKRLSSKALDWSPAQSGVELLDFSIESTFLRVLLHVCVSAFSRFFSENHSNLWHKSAIFTYVAIKSNYYSHCSGPGAKIYIVPGCAHAHNNPGSHFDLPYAVYLWTKPSDASRTRLRVFLPGFTFYLNVFLILPLKWPIHMLVRRNNSSKTKWSVSSYI